MLHDSDQTIGNDGCTDLDPDGILCSAPEFLDFQMLLQPLEEELNLPPVLIEIGNLKRGPMGEIRSISPVLNPLYTKAFRKI